jgi:glycosyltransferase involved in cell wall biosynthesis
VSVCNSPRSGTGERKRRLAFISTVFLLPADAGGKIRTGNILRGMQGGAFEITLVMPATPEQLAQWGDELKRLCDHLVTWLAPKALPRWTRAADLMRTTPANVANDATASARRTVARLLDQTEFDVVVYDFVHAAVLRPVHTQSRARSVCFTHNVEAEIFERHAKTAAGALMRRVWASQAEKMRRFEGEALRGFDSVIAVSERDGQQFSTAYAVNNPQVIPTGVDLDFFSWQAPVSPTAEQPPTVVFTGSMDWAANVDGVRFFLADIWPLVLQKQPDARFTVVGRHPPAALLREAEGVAGVTFTGFVDDVRPYVRAAQAFVIPLRVGGGTRIKAFEAMAMGCPLVSTAVGIEGLGVAPDEHYLLCDSTAEQAAAVLRLFNDAALRQSLSQAAREQVEQRYGHRVAALAFEQICLRAGNPAPSATAAVAVAAAPA